MTTLPAPSSRPKQGLAIASLVIGVLALPTLGCLLVGAAVGIVMGVVALVRANREPETYGGTGFAIGGIALSALSIVLAIPIGGIVAAIAIPSLLRARVSANESVAIGDTRTVISGQAAYQSISGAYGSLECLGAPATCIRDYNGPTFLDPQFAASEVKSGYRRAFHPGPPATEGATVRAGYQSFAVTMHPVTAGQTGVRSFCGDSSGRVCANRTGDEIDASEGSCPSPPACEDLY